jgi:hypothetical protein
MRWLLIWGAVIIAIAAIAEHDDNINRRMPCGYGISSVTVTGPHGERVNGCPDRSP